MPKKTIFTIIAIIVAIGGAALFFWNESATAKFVTATAQKGAIAQEVSASGAVEPPQTLNLYFKTGGKMVELKVKTGDSVAAGQILAEQDTSQLEDQLNQAQAGVDAAQAKLNQLLAGASSENIILAQTAAANAQKALANAQSADDTARQGASNSIRDAYAKADDAVRNYADRLFTDPAGPNPSFNVTITSAAGTAEYRITENDIDKKLSVNYERKNIETILDEWEKSVKDLSAQNAGDLPDALAKSSTNLRLIQKFLNDIAATVNSYNAENLADDAVYQGYRTGILTARNEISGALDIIMAAQAALKSSGAGVDAASGAQKSAQDQLALTAAPARQTDAAIVIAAINQAQVAEELIRGQINDLTIVAPVGGVITATNGNVGEIVSPAVPTAVLIPSAGMQIKLNVSENNIINVKTGQSVDIALDALGSDHLAGTVTAIDPAETIISGAVYYKTTVDFSQLDDRIRSGMTVNALIKTVVHDGAIVVPASAVAQDGSDKFVQILQKKQTVKQIVQTGIESNDGMVEIVSGLDEGQKIVLDTK